jgi:hypothetical protein
MGVVGARAGRWVQVLVVIGSGCGHDYGSADNPSQVTDVSGVPFAWTCDASGCELGRTAETPFPDPCSSDDQPAYSYAWGRFFDVCSVCVPSSGAGWSTTPGQCRMLACQTSADCPVIYGYSPVAVYECVDGLCEAADTSAHPRNPLRREDAEDLCFATHPRADTVSFGAPATIAVESELDANCTGTDPFAICTLPDDCRAP